MKIQTKGFKDSYITKTFQVMSTEYVEKILKKYCTKDKDICALGCHSDILVDQIEFKTLALVDLRFGELKHLHEYGDFKLHYHECDLYYFLSNCRDVELKFDVIIMNDIIEHLDHGKGISTLKIIKDVLTDDGILILAYPNCRSVNRLVGVEKGILEHPGDLSDGDKEVGHKRMYSYKSIPWFRQMSEMEIVETLGIMFKPLPNSMMDEYFENELDKFMELGRKLGIETCAKIVVVFKNVS